MRRSSVGQNSDSIRVADALILRPKCLRMTGPTLLVRVPMEVLDLLLDSARRHVRLNEEDVREWARATPPVATPGLARPGSERPSAVHIELTLPFTRPVG